MAEATDVRGRWLFAATAAAALVGVGIQVAVAAGNADGAFFDTELKRALNVFVFFTIQSNLLVAATSVMLFADPRRDGAWFRVLRLAGLIGIVVTFLVYHAVLAHLYEFAGWAKVADQLTHTVAPLLAIIAWFRVGPRGVITRRTAALTVIPAAAWLAFTLIRGEIVGFYPYPFVDVGEHGYAVVAVNATLVALLFYGLGRAAVWIDRRLGADRAEGPPGRPDGAAAPPSLSRAR